MASEDVQENEFDVMSDDEEDEVKQEDQIQVRFKTKLEQYRITDSPMFVPSRLARYGLSEVVNHLLDNEKIIPFDFIAKGMFLRSNLKSFIKKHQISSENILELEYVVALREDKEGPTYQHDDWISDIAINSSNSCLTSCYDGVVRFWHLDKENCVSSHRCHTKAVKAIAITNQNAKDENNIEFITGSLDYTIKHWKMNKATRKDAKKSHRFVLENEYVGHSSGVEALAVKPGGFQFCSGSWDGKVNVWILGEELDSDDEQPTKKKKQTKSTTKQRAPFFSFKGHTGCVSCLAWEEQETCISGSWDHSLRFWDISTGVAGRTLNSTKVINCLSYNKKTGLVVTGHEDNLVRIWDARSTAGEVIKKRLRSHKGFVMDIQWHPSSSTLFSSCSNDGTVKVWDTRSSLPLVTFGKRENNTTSSTNTNTNTNTSNSSTSINSSEDKRFCVTWHDSNSILSGGSNCKLQTNHISKDTLAGYAIL